MIALELMDLITTDRPGEYAYKLDGYMKRGEICLGDVLQLIGLIKDAIVEYYANEGFEERYTSLCYVLQTCAYFLVAEVKKAIPEGRIKLEDTLLVGTDDVIAYEELKNLLEEIDNAEDCAEWDRYRKFALSISEFESGDYSHFGLQARLMDKIDEDNALLIMHMVSYFEDIITGDIEEVKNYVNTSDFTLDELIEEHYRINSSSFCFVFLDLASPAEKSGIDAAMKKIKEKRSEKDVIIGIAERDIWLSNWFDSMPFLPYTTYHILTDDEYEIKLKK